MAESCGNLHAVQMNPNPPAAVAKITAAGLDWDDRRHHESRAENARLRENLSG